MPSLVTVHLSSDLQMPYESGEANRLQLPYIIYNSFTKMQSRLKHSVKVTPLTGLSMSIIPISPLLLVFSKSCQIQLMLRTFQGWSTFMYGWKREGVNWNYMSKSLKKKCGPVKRWGQQIVILQSMLLSLSSLHSSLQKGTLLVFITSLALCWCEVTVLAETKSYAIWAELLSLPLNYTIR